jgi:hypothetical protein
MIRHTSASPLGSKMMKSTMANPKMNSRRGAIWRATLLREPIFIKNSVALLNISFKTVMKIAPKTAPGILPRPPMIIIAIYSTERKRV